VEERFVTIEKRRYLRLLDNFRVDLRPWELTGSRSTGPVEPADEPGSAEPSPVVAFSRDLSVGGICVHGDTSVAPGTLVEAEIIVPEIEQPLKVVGEVVRCSPGPKGRYELALRFVPHWIDDRARAALEGLVYGKAGRPGTEDVPW
jgi:hypothetical protein